MDTAELGRCHAPIKSRRPVLCVRRAAHQPTSHDSRVGHLLSEPDPPALAPDGDTHPLIARSLRDGAAFFPVYGWDLSN